MTRILYHKMISFATIDKKKGISLTTTMAHYDRENIKIVILVLRKQLLHQMSSINQAVAEGFFLIGCTQTAAEVKDGVVIAQGQRLQETLKFLETFDDFRRVSFVGFGIGLVELVENGFCVTVPGIKGMVACVGFQCFGKGLQDNTS